MNQKIAHDNNRAFLAAPLFFKFEKFFKFWILLLIAGIPSTVFCLLPTPHYSIRTLGANSDSEPPPKQYYIINENDFIQNSNSRQNFSTPLQLIGSAAQRVVADLPLTSWALKPEPPPLPSEKYNRKFHFGTWINDPDDQLCFNTRAKVLIRDSRRPVTYSSTNRCRVAGGLWQDPYTGKNILDTKLIQIDHLVPLKHAYTTGGFKWNYRARCLYGNFIANNYHLVSVDAHENMSKGDRGPDLYMPPNRNIACSYLQRWLQIKLAWGLVIFPREAQAISALTQFHRCDLQKFTMNTTELKKLRIAMMEASPACAPKPSL